MNIQCSAVIFDFDGTLADSMPFLESIGVEIMMKYYRVSREEAIQRYRMTTGLPYEHQIEMNFPENPINEKAVEEFERLKIERIYEQSLFPDAVDVLQKLKSIGFRLFVSSSTFQPTITEYFRRKGLLNLLDGIMGYRPSFEKGADHFRHVQNHYGVDLDEVVFVGDSLKDYERSRGFCQFIAISRMFNIDEFRKLGHKGPIVKELSEVPQYLEMVKH